ncbi:MAG: hypothetical protein EON55_19605, partial [Alphaproteobacteria bacterium]
MTQRNAPPDRSQVDGAARPIAETSRPSIIERTIEFAGSGEFTALEPPKSLDREGYADVAGHL